MFWFCFSNRTRDREIPGTFCIPHWHFAAARRRTHTMPSAHVFDTACVCAAGRTAGCVTCKISRAAGCAAGSSVIFDAQLAALLAAASSREIIFASRAAGCTAGGLASHSCVVGCIAGCVTCIISRAVGCTAGRSSVFDAQLAALPAAASSREIFFAVDFFQLYLRCFSGRESTFLESMHFLSSVSLAFQLVTLAHTKKRKNALFACISS